MSHWTQKLVCTILPFIIGFVAVLTVGAPGWHIGMNPAVDTYETILSEAGPSYQTRTWNFDCGDSTSTRISLIFGYEPTSQDRYFRYEVSLGELGIVEGTYSIGKLENRIPVLKLYDRAKNVAQTWRLKEGGHLFQRVTYISGSESQPLPRGCAWTLISVA